jgi:hypothetical protein
MDLESLDAEIEAAFRNVERDEDCTLHQAQLSDQGMRREISDTEWRAAKAKDQETDWRRVPASFLDECDAALSHATPQGWRFYMPAFMRRALQLLDTDIMKTMLPGSVIFHLTYRDKAPGDAAYALERFNTITVAQSQAVTSFLEYIRDHPTSVTSCQGDAELALRKFWGLDRQKRPQGPKIILP